MENKIEERMISAIELFHYAQRFRGQTFAFIIEDAESLQHILSDLRVLHSAGIHSLVFCRTDERIKKLVDKWNQCGYYFEPVLFSNKPQDLPQTRNLLNSLIQKGISPIVFFDEQPSLLPPKENSASTTDYINLEFYRQALELAKGAHATKAFFLSKEHGLIVNGHFHSYPSSCEVQAFLQNDCEINIGREMLAFIHSEQKRLEIDIVLIEAAEGVLFTEIFTHEGAGSLFSDEYENAFRLARKNDVCDISMIMHPYIKNGTMLPISEEAILDDIQSWYVFTINREIVATARLTRYGRSVELGKLCTLPRFRGKGRARELITKLIRIAKEQSYDSIFALTISTKTADLFRKIGFHEVDRANLPQEWKEKYDFSRPSKAYAIDLLKV